MKCSMMDPYKLMFDVPHAAGGYPIKPYLPEGYTVAGLMPGPNRAAVHGSDGLVTRALLAILERGAFPDWTRLILGGGAEAVGTSPT